VNLSLFYDDDDDDDAKNNNNDETGVTLYHNWAKYYGPKGMMPYFLKTDGAVALVSFFFFLHIKNK